MPTNEELYDEADRLKDQGQFPEAIDKLLAILEQEETHVLTHAALAVLYGKVGKHEKAIEHGQRVCALEPSDPFSFTALSVTLQRAFAGTGSHHFIQLAEDAMAKSRMLQQARG